jgi:hypothetical protein
VARFGGPKNSIMQNAPPVSFPDISKRARVPAKLYSGGLVFNTNMAFLDKIMDLDVHYKPPGFREKDASMP